MRRYVFIGAVMGLCFLAVAESGSTPESTATVISTEATLPTTTELSMNSTFKSKTTVELTETVTVSETSTVEGETVFETVTLPETSTVEGETVFETVTLPEISTVEGETVFETVTLPEISTFEAETVFETVTLPETSTIKGETAAAATTVLTELEQRKKELEEELEELQNSIAANNATASAFAEIEATLQRITDAINSSGRHRRRRSPTYSVNQGGDTVTVDPYCEVNEDNALTGDPTDLLLTMINDLSTKLSNLTTDQIICFNELIGYFATLIENGTFVIDSSMVDNITAAAETASSAVGEEVESLKTLISSLQDQVNEKNAELRKLESDSTSTAASTETDSETATIFGTSTFETIILTETSTVILPETTFETETVSETVTLPETSTIILPETTFETETVSETVTLPETSTIILPETTFETETVSETVTLPEISTIVLPETTFETETVFETITLPEITETETVYKTMTLPETSTIISPEASTGVVFETSVLPEASTPEPPGPAPTTQETSDRVTELQDRIAELAERSGNLRDVDDSIGNFTAAIANTRKRRSASLAISQDGQDITLDPYCGVNGEDSLVGNTSYVLLAVLTDLTEEVSNLTTDQISCYSLLLEKFTELIENGTITIDPLFKSSIVSAANAASDAVQEELSSTQDLIADLQEELDALIGESTTTVAPEPEPEPEPGPEPLPVPAPHKTRLRLVVLQQVNVP